MNAYLPKVQVTLTEDPKDARYGVLRGGDGRGSKITGEVATGPLIADRFKAPWPEHPRDVLLRSLDAPAAWLFRLEVPKSLRTAGRGSALLAATLDFLRDFGVRYVALAPRPETYEMRDALLRFYQRFGFERRGDYLVLDFEQLP